MPLQKILPDLVGNTYKYRGDKYQVTGYEIKDKAFVLETDRGPLEIPTVEKAEFFENFIKVKPEIKAAETAVAETAIAETGEVTKAALTLQKGYRDTSLGIKAALLNAIDKVAEDPSYIKQANALVQVSNAVMNVYKLEFQMVRLAEQKEARRGRR